MLMIGFSAGRRARLRLAHCLLVGSSGVLIETDQALAQTPARFLSGFMHQGHEQDAGAGQLALQAMANEQGVLPGLQPR